MNAYLVSQAQQMERARTQGRRRAVWPFGALSARRRRTVVPCEDAV
jgi:hypothetical protein